MEYRTLGKTGLEVSKLGFGGSPLGGVFGRIDEAEAVRAVHMALDRGVNFIDVSPFYGLTRAETVLGRALKGVPRDSYYLATKVGRYGDTEFDFSPRRVMASVDESLHRLNVEYIDLIQCHDIEFGSLDQIVTETLPALRKIRDQDKARLLGITGLPLKIYRAVLDRFETDTVLSYCHYCLYDTSLESMLPYFESKHLGVICAAPLGMGLLTVSGPPVWHPAPPEIRAACAKAAAYCQAKGVDIARLALQFSVSNPKIHTVLVGMADRDTVNKNLSALDLPLDLDLLREVQALFEPIRDATWTSGRSENN